MDRTAFWPYPESIGNFFGRDAEIQYLHQAIGAGDDGLRIAHISGPSGIGKSSLVRQLIEANNDYDTHWIVGRGFAATAPGNAVLEAYPQTAAILQNIGSIDSHEAVQAAARDFREMVMSEAIASPQLIVVDDVQTLDATSLSLVGGLVQLTDEANISIVFVEQSDVGRTFTDFRSVLNEFESAHVVLKLDIGRLDAKSVHEMVTSIVGEVSETQLQSLEERSMGNPAWVTEFSRALLAGGDASRIPESTVAAARMRLEALDDTQRSTMELLAVADVDGVPREWLFNAIRDWSECSHSEFDSLYGKLVEYGLCREVGDGAQIAHPLLHTAILESQSRATVRALHKEWMVALSEIDEGPAVAAAIAVHTAQLGFNEAAVEHFVRSATLHRESGNADAALTQLRRALSLPAAEVALVPVAKSAVCLAIHIGSRSTEQLIDELVHSATIVGDSDALACGLLNKFWTASSNKDVALLERAVSVGGSSSGWAQRAAACWCFVESRDMHDAINHDETAIKLAQANDDRWLEIWAKQRLAVSLSTIGEFQRSITLYEETIKLAAQDRMHNIAVHGYLHIAGDHADSLRAGEATAVVERAHEYLTAHRLNTFEPLVTFYTCLFLLGEGKLKQARGAFASLDFDLTDYVDESSILLSYVDAMIAIECGDLAATENAVTRLSAYVQQHGIASDVFLLATTNVRLAELRGDTDTMTSVLCELEEIDEPTIVTEFGLWAARSSLWNKQNSLAEFADRQVALFSGSEIPAARIAVGEMQAILQRDAVALAEVAQRWKEAGRELDAARCALARLAVIREQDPALIERDEVVLVHRQLRTLDASFDADRAARLGRDTGTQLRSPQERPSDYSQVQNVGHALSDRNWQVLDLLSHGLTNNQIADRLMISESTLRGRLTELFRLSGVENRMQLVRWAEDLPRRR